MTHGLDLEALGLAGADAAARAPTSRIALVGVLERLLAAVNRLIVAFASLALVAASLILSYSVVVRYALKMPTYWQDEASVFLLVGATFLSAAHVQSKRGHIGIEALMGFLSPRANRIRLLAVDLASLAFCAFFAWKSWTLLHEAWVDGQVSGSTWAPPLWIPYSIMATGMTLLSAQILLQVLHAVTAERRP
jgi:TRAP-type C4-dicarboxylate transport system permease small subunit